jgi:hypothetical protein
MSRKAEAVWSWVMLMGIGLVLLRIEALPPDWYAREAPVRFNEKNRTVTPAGGVSVIVRLAGTTSMRGSPTWEGG